MALMLFSSLKHDGIHYLYKGAAVHNRIVGLHTEVERMEYFRFIIVKRQCFTLLTLDWQPGLDNYTELGSTLITSLVLPFSPGSPGPTSCPDTGAPTPEWSRTSASSARRSLPAAITCRNTSKSTAFHEAAGQDALQTDSSDPALTDWR